MTGGTNSPERAGCRGCVSWGREDLSFFGDREIREARRMPLGIDGAASPVGDEEGEVT